jgi:hypothetical protein
MKPRISIATMMSVNALVAIDWFLVQEIHEGWWLGGYGFSGAGIFLIVQILVLGPLRMLLRDGKRHPFAIGFAILGIVAAVAHCLLWRFFPISMYAAIDFSGQPIRSLCETFLPAYGSVRWFSNREPLVLSLMWYHFESQPDAAYPLLVAFFMVLVTTPIALGQLLIALSGGFAARALIRRRPVGGE